MKLTIGEIFRLNEGCKSIMSEKMPSKTSYWIGRLVDKLEPIMNRANKELDKYRYQVDDVDKEAKEVKFQEQANLLFSDFEELEFTNTFSVDDFEGAKVSPIFWVLMKPVLTEETN